MKAPRDTDQSWKSRGSTSNLLNSCISIFHLTTTDLPIVLSVAGF